MGCQVGSSKNGWGPWLPLVHGGDASGIYEEVGPATKFLKSLPLLPLRWVLSSEFAVCYPVTFVIEPAAATPLPCRDSAGSAVAEWRTTVAGLPALYICPELYSSESYEYTYTYVVTIDGNGKISL